MKMIGAALLGSVFTMLLVVLVFKDRLFSKPAMIGGVLELRELHILDDAGEVRMSLGTHGRWSSQGSPTLELLPRGSERGGAAFLLDKSGRGTLIFDSVDTAGKVTVGHFVTGDSLPLSESNHSWGMRVLNPQPAQGAPSSLYFAVSEGGNVGISGLTIKQGLAPDIQPVRAH